MKDYDKNKESSSLKYSDRNNLYGSAMSQKLPVNNIEWIEDTSQFKEEFMKNYNKDSDKYICLKLMFNILSELHKYLPFFPERIKIEKVKKLVSNLHDETEYFIHKKKI